MRAGAYGLSLLSDPLDAQVLQALEDGAVSLIDLRRIAGSPPQTTLRKHLKALTGLGLLVRTQQEEFPAAVKYELSDAGRDLRAAARAVEAWLFTSPAGPLPLGRPGTKSAIKSLVDAWTTKMLRALAARPLSLTELDRLLAGVNYPALERRLTALRLAGQVEVASERSGGTPYRVTRWLREAVGPLVAVTVWESAYRSPGREPLNRLDVEALFLLAVPLVTVPATLSGTCRLIVDLSGGKKEALAGAVVRFEGGRPISCVADLRAEATATVIGSGAAWLNALSKEQQADLFLEGDRALCEALLSGLQRVCLPEVSVRLPAASVGASRPEPTFTAALNL